MSATTGWHAHLALTYRYERSGDGITRAHDLHHGPLRVLKAMYPEGPRVCHHVLVHPPGGVAGGDRLEVDVDVGAGAHALITTPGATRFYRSSGEPAAQSVRVHAHSDARIEWLPMASIAYDGCIAANSVRFTLDERAQMIGADVVALGLPASDAPFARGRFTQHLEWPGRWLERGVIDAADQRLLHSPLGLGGHSVMATLWCAGGSAFTAAQREALLDAARDGAHTLEGSTAPAPGLVLWRGLADSIEPLWQRLTVMRARWRQVCWGLTDNVPRVWHT
jgi:urease accessory protein